MIIREKELGDGRREMLPFNRDTALAETCLCTVIAFIFTPVARVLLSNTFIPTHITITLSRE